MFRRFLEVMKFTSPLFAKAATIAQTTSGLTPNWSEYPADCKPLLGMQRLKCSVAESDGHRIVTHNLNPYLTEGVGMRRGHTQTGHPSTSIPRRKLWTGVVVWPRGKDSNSSLTAQMVKSRIPTVMVLIHVLPRTRRINHPSSQRR